MPSHPTSSPQWKQEVNRRLAAHRSRRQQQIEDEDLFPTKPHASGRAAQAAARVAARYASAPSFAALDAALTNAQPELPFAAPLPGAPRFMSEPKAPAIPTRRKAVAPRAQAAPVTQPSAPVAAQEPQKQVSAAVAQPEPVVHVAAPAVALATAPSTDFELTPMAREPHAELKKKTHAAAKRAAAESEAQAEDNLLFFPSEPAPSRRSRTRAQETAFGVAGAAALSIFEVDPVIDSSPIAAAVAPAPAAEKLAAPVAEAIAVPAAVAAPAPWTAPVEEPAPLPALSPLPSARLDREEEIELEPDPAPSVARICAAPLQRRLMAMVVDAGLVALAFIGAAAVAATHMPSLPSVHAMKTIAMAALMAIGLLYLAFFSAVAEATPGMCYAGLKLRQHNHRKPNRERRMWRTGALLLSLAPLGLGMLWVFFDKERLSLRDRISGTYLWKR